MKYKIKKIIWYTLEKLDHIIIHGIVNKLWNFPVENKDGSDSIYYKIWKNSFRKICEFIVIDLYDNWFPNGIDN